LVVYLDLDSTQKYLLLFALTRTSKFIDRRENDRKSFPETGNKNKALNANSADNLVTLLKNNKLSEAMKIYQAYEPNQ
jgi:hypothetical protein